MLGWKCRGWRVPPVPPLGPSERRALGSESQSLYLGAAFRAGCSSSHPRGPYQPRAGGFPALISLNSGRAVGAAVRASRIAPRPLRPPQVSDPKGQGKGLGGGFGAAGGHLGSCFGLFSSWGGSATSRSLQPPPRARGWWHEVPNTGTSPSGGCVVGMKFPQFESFAEGSGGTKPSGWGFSGEMRGRRCIFRSEERSRRLNNPGAGEDKEETAGTAALSAAGAGLRSQLAWTVKKSMNGIFLEEFETCGRLSCLCQIGSVGCRVQSNGIWVEKLLSGWFG